MKSAFTFILFYGVVSGAFGASGSKVLSKTEQNVRDIWSATNTTAQQRAAAVNSCFTNGTPISRVLDVIGKWDEHHQKITTADPVEKESRALVYRLGPDRITIHAKGSPGTRTENCAFVGAFVWRPSDFGQQRGAANWSQPVLPDTNRAPPAAGSSR
jgi:hypothetical protein